MNISLEDIEIRSDIRPGDLGYVMHRHGRNYALENQYGVAFEMYVGEGLCEFYRNYDPKKDRVWICEHQEQIVGFLLLMHRSVETAQLRYFYLEKAYRGIGLGGKLMQLYLEFLQKAGYQSAYLWTTQEQSVAAHLYAKYGFVLSETKESSLFGKRLEEHRYDLLL